MRKTMFGGIALVAALASGMASAQQWPTHTLTACASFRMIVRRRNTSMVT
jgi:hypothetical protein